MVMVLFPLQLFALEPLVGKKGEALPGDTVIQPTKSTPENTGPVSPDRVLPGEHPHRKNYLIPALEIPAFLLSLNIYDRFAYPDTVYNTGVGTFKDHFKHGHWTLDQDPFDINQFGHPFQGAIMYGFARSTGLNFYESLLYANVGEFVWKMGGENGPIGLEDQITTAQAGSIFGEEIYRMASLILERGGEKPAKWREWAAAFVSPATGLNRVVFGDRFREIESRRPALAANLRLGVDFNAQATSTNGLPRSVNQKAGSVDYRLAYGLPGKPGYKYLRPLDYFVFETKVNFDRVTPFELFMTRGLVIGKKYDMGDAYRGVWGLYGSYDYIVPGIFHLSSTAVSLGTTGQWWLSRTVALQGTGMGGVGLGASGGVTEPTYHYGTTPQALLALRLIVNDRFMLDTTAREYYVGPRHFIDTDQQGAHGKENVMRVDTSVNYRITGPHAVSLQYFISRRDTYYSDQDNHHQMVGTVNVAYSYLFDSHFGAVEWGRP